MNRLKKYVFQVALTVLISMVVLSLHSITKELGVCKCELGNEMAAFDFVLIICAFVVADKVTAMMYK